MSKKTSFIKAQPLTKEKSLTLLLLAAFSFAYTFCVSVFSPIVDGIISGDSSIFYFVGEMWSEGLVPYSEVFDHKGPFIFFVYMLGHSLCGRVGVYLLQTVSLFFTLYFAYKIISKELKLSLPGLATVFGILVFLPGVEYGEALTEEFCLPFLMASAYFANEYFLRCKTKAEHCPAHAAVYGIAFAVALCTRITNGVAVAAWVATVTVVLIINKKFLNLLYNIIGFILGFAAVTVPFVIYFACKGALYDMIYGTLLYNFMYATGSSLERDTATVLLHLYRILPAILLLVLSATLSVRKNIALTTANIVAATLSVYVSVSGNAYGHYAIILAVFIPVSVSYALSEFELKNKKIPTLLPGSFACLLLAVCIGICQVKASAFASGEKTKRMKDIAFKIVSYIPEEDRDEVIGYNMESRFYMYTDIVPCFKYYTLQDWQSGKSEDMIEENVEFYRSGKAKWIAVNYSVDLEPIRNAIEENYSFYAHEFDGENSITLYKRNY